LKRRSQRSPGAQRGYVTVFIAVLFGLAFTATVLGSAAYIRSTEAVSVASHAQVQAQLKAWTGVEVVREYLAALQTSGSLPALAAVVANSSTPLVINGVSGISASLVAVDNATNPSLITAQIVGTTATGTPAQATSIIQAVYSISTGSGGSSVAALNFNRNLVLGGSIKVIAPTGSTQQYQINVLGDLSTSGNSISGVATINATGTINITSGSSFTNLNSNCDVVISGSVHSTNVNALRNVCETGGAYVSGTALANGSVLAQASALSGSTGNGTISAIANATGVSSCTASGASQSGTTAATCPVPTISGVDLSAGDAGAAVVNTDGSVILASGTIGKLYAQGSLDVTSAGSVGAGTIGGTLTKPSWNNSVNVTTTSGYKVSITPATPVVVPTAQFNANALESLANYAFTISSGGFMQVTINNVNGITSGTYFIGNYGAGSPYNDYLCTALTATSTVASQTCLTPSSPTNSTKICQGYSPENSCFSYSKSTGWTIAGTSMAPGIAWFSGNLVVSNGTYYNTFIATGNVSTSGSNTTYAPNYAGYSGTVDGETYAPTGVCTNSYFPTLYPTQLCTISTETYDATASSSIGNYAFMAGSWVGSTYPGQSGYVGGNITIGASSVVYGDIKAGNEFQSGGSTSVFGSITALAQGTAAENSMGGSTTINLSKIPATLDVTGGTANSVSSTTTNGSGTSGVIIQWARYL
jgi:hypothetical protein